MFVVVTIVPLRPKFASENRLVARHFVKRLESVLSHIDNFETCLKFLCAFVVLTFLRMIRWKIEDVEKCPQNIILVSLRGNWNPSLHGGATWQVHWTNSDPFISCSHPQAIKLSRSFPHNTDSRVAASTNHRKTSAQLPPKEITSSILVSIILN